LVSQHYYNINGKYEPVPKHHAITYRRHEDKFPHGLDVNIKQRHVVTFTSQPLLIGLSLEKEVLKMKYNNITQCNVV
jgi:hypothetical protein